MKCACIFVAEYNPSLLRLRVFSRALRPENSTTAPAVQQQRTSHSTIHAGETPVFSVPPFKLSRQPRDYKSTSRGDTLHTTYLVVTCIIEYDNAFIFIFAF